ncbi:CHAD domain-containing protein [Spirulina sp. 06S082]|uniref:CHAD domain-containing protein n=1 Tax=Spirulina sp. 06S082 TaxID=3110248 RepID=UPI002B1FF6E8|nr:CHAD domain-containing protein [Spirulina sp. 06S082]MEA5468754.1 CHAD domain-containing protein [Spirulina sp. 06S082]
MGKNAAWGKEAEIMTFANLAYIAIAQHYWKTISYEAGVLADRDSEELHQMRVSMRRLRTALVGFAPILSLPAIATEKAVGRVAKVLGKLRDIDVLEATLKTEYRPQLPKAERQKLDRLLKRLAKDRKKAFKAVKKTLKGKTYLHLKNGFTSWLEKPHYSSLACLPLELILPDLLLPQFSQLLLHPGWWVEAGDRGEIPSVKDSAPDTICNILVQQEKKLHSLRKSAKRTRYQMELFEQFYGKEYEIYLKQIKTVQSILGDLQDSFVLQEFLNRFFAKSFQTELPHLAQHLQEIRQQKWQAWQDLQQKFSCLETRQSFRAIAQSPHFVRE